MNLNDIVTIRVTQYGHIQAEAVLVGPKALRMHNNELHVKAVPVRTSNTDVERALPMVGALMKRGIRGSHVFLIRADTVEEAERKLLAAYGESPSCEATSERGATEAAQVWAAETGIIHYGEMRQVSPERPKR